MLCRVAPSHWVRSKDVSEATSWRLDGDFQDFLVLKAVQRRDTRGGVMAGSGQPADINRPCRPQAC